LGEIADLGIGQGDAFYFSKNEIDLFAQTYEQMVRSFAHCMLTEPKPT
jgi:hypothetical protein